MIIKKTSEMLFYFSEYCRSEPDAGPCTGRKIQWFYDKDGVCKQFYYGGCRGNGNRFNTKKECEVKCATSQGKFSV